ncbi:GntR family transcriptional regulator [Pseudoroseomonas ludipueritiae]|uniref:GntR family transcriptional regulator n=1 Tax=Pseudoroseomonas ludipueritiae TaxID=198093 RepID=A0ABR7R9U5_9PROT|nr:GntR family transcriptional regulator [Pseudoroseomonas ludipueritiae]MBC9178586.1 GntR family transcriptional regulator [Pseudoroseomonas ludipueritiae]MCG7360868.1 GntR family transcriptional regulator [Roseomonas sp. ACRSG]
MDTASLQVATQVVTLRSALGDTLRAAILSGHFAPGQRLVERELCELTGASRASVRETLRQLEAEGLVVIRPHRGPSVTAISAEDARHLFGVRGVLQGYAARLCAEQRPAAALKAISEATAELEAAAAETDTRRIVAAGDAFHHAIAEGSGNPVLQGMFVSVHNRLALLRNLSMARPARVRDGIAAYQAIRDAIQAGEAARAEALCIRHNDAGLTVALGILVESGSRNTGEAKAG